MRTRDTRVLVEMRKKSGLTQAEVADAMGVSQQRVSAIESGAVAEQDDKLSEPYKVA